MSDRQDENLERLLRSRRIESPSPDLAQRIIFQAQRIPQLEPITFAEWLGVIFKEFHLPKPVYVLAAALLVGTLVGLSTPIGTPASNDESQVKIQSFLYADEAIL
jgi:hypothetical protein